MLTFRLTSMALLTGAIAVSCAIPTRAEKPLPTTLSTSVSPMYQSGEIIGCQLEFQVVRSDPEYSDGRPVHISGNLNFWVFEEKDPAVGLKLGVSEISKIYDKKPPFDAYLMNGYRTNISEQIGKSDGEGGSRIFGYKLGKLTSNVAFDDIIKNKKFTFSYSMIKEGLDAIVAVDLTVEKLDLENVEKSVVGDRTVKDWAECISQTTDAEIARLKVRGAADN